MSNYFPSRDLSNQYVSQSYQDVLQKHQSGSNVYVLDALGNEITHLNTSSVGNQLMTTDMPVISASYSQTASLAITYENIITNVYQVSSSFAIISLYASASGFADDAAHALVADYAVNTITSSFANSASYAFSSNNAISSSWALTASYFDDIDLTVPSSSWASASISSSFATTSSWALTASYFNDIDLSATSASWASASISASYALSSSYAAIATTASAATSITFIPTTASFATTASWALTASYFNDLDLSAVSASWASASISSSYALSSSYTTTASYATTSSWALTASYFNDIDLTVPSASWASSSISASYALSASWAPDLTITQISASYALTASWALTASYFNDLDLSAVSASWASASISASYAISASWAPSLSQIQVSASWASSSISASFLTYGRYNVSDITASSLLTNNADFTQIQAGSAIPFYMIANWPTLGFNAYYGAGSWRYGAGSVSQWGAYQDINPGTGEMDYFFSPAAGNAGDSFTGVKVLSMTPTGVVKYPLTFTVQSLVQANASGILSGIPITGSVYPITSSWAQTASYFNDLDLSSVSSSWASSSISSSYSTTASFAPNQSIMILGLGPSSTQRSGSGNTASGACSTVSGGYGNSASNSYTTIGGGWCNCASGNTSTIGGGSLNVTSLVSATVSGGYKNIASGSYATIGGGCENTARGDCSTIGGGHGNKTCGSYGSTVSGGYHNFAISDGSIIAGGSCNTVEGIFGGILGGRFNVISSSYTDSFVVGSCIDVNTSCTTFVNNLNVQSAITLGGIACSTWPTPPATSSYADNAGFATSASYSNTSSYSIFAEQSLSATTASAATSITFTPASASFATSASTALSSSYSLSSSYAKSASYVPNLYPQTEQISASWASSSLTASSVNLSLNAYIQANTSSAEPAWAPGRLFWDNANHTYAMFNDQSQVTLQIGQENYIRVIAGEALNDGKPIYISGSVNSNPVVYLAQADMFSQKSGVVGITTQTFSSGSEGWITIQGRINGLNTLGLFPGGPIFLSTTPGGFSPFPPGSPYATVLCGYCIVSDASAGKILVDIVGFPATPNVCAGTVVTGSLTNNNDGTITIGSGSVNLFATSAGSGVATTYPVAQKNLTLITGSTNYVIAEHSGSLAAEYNLTTDSSYANDINIARVANFDINYEGPGDWELHILNVGIVGLALANRSNNKDIILHGIQRQSGLSLYTTGSFGDFGITSGTIWYGPNQHILGDFLSSNSGSCDTYHYVKSSSVWTFSNTPFYDNLNYQGPAGLLPLAPLSWSANFVYRIASSATDAIIVLAEQEFNTEVNAVNNAQPPSNLPPLITDMSTLAGLIVIQSGSYLNPNVQSAYNILFAPATVTDHESLTGLQGGTGGEHHHLTEIEYTGTGTGVFVRQSGASITGSITAATSASYAINSSQAVSASYATTSSWALTASYFNDIDLTVPSASWASASISSSYTLSSSYAISASYATTSFQAVSSSYALSSSYAEMATSASYAAAATSASYATASFQAVSSSYALSSSYAAIATSASYATASFQSVSASYAAVVTSASYAEASFIAVSASYAPGSPTISSSYTVSSSFAVQSTSASYASYSPSISSFGMTVDGGGNTITTGLQGVVSIPYNGNIINWQVATYNTGSIVYDIKKDNISIIGGGNAPTLVSSSNSNVQAISGWTSASISSGNIIQFYVSSVSSEINWVSLAVGIVKI